MIITSSSDALLALDLIFQIAAGLKNPKFEGGDDAALKFLRDFSASSEPEPDLLDLRPLAAVYVELAVALRGAREHAS